MKKCILGIIPLVMLVTMCAGGAKPVESSAANSGGMMTLDQALKEAAVRIDERLAAKTKIAPLNFNSPHDKFSGYVLDEVTANLVDSGKLTVVDRKEVDLIRGEFDFQFSGEVGDDSMQQLGRMLGAQSIISGSLTDMGGFYRIVIRVLNVQNASVEVQYRANIASDTIMTALLTGGKTAVAARTPQRAPITQAATTPAQAQAVPTQAPAVPATPIIYKVGDRGPAGGWICYDKGNNLDGWRYLEAAPASGESIAQWSEAYLNLSSTQKNIGSGKTNTEIICAAKQYEFDKAAQRCDELELNGYTDWFLPSFAELNQMYTQLRRKRIGDFKDEIYWSSSQGEAISNSYGAGCINFTTGEITWPYKTERHYVRPIRWF